MTMRLKKINTLIAVELHVLSSKGDSSCDLPSVMLLWGAELGPSGRALNT